MVFPQESRAGMPAAPSQDKSPNKRVSRKATVERLETEPGTGRLKCLWKGCELAARGVTFSDAAELWEHANKCHVPGNRGSELAGPLKLASEERAAARKSPAPAPPYACFWDTCALGYNKPYRLREHIAAHVGHRMHKCPKCESAFSKLDTKRVHMTTHLTERIHCRVPGCDKSYSSLRALKRHVETNHRDGDGPSRSGGGGLQVVESGRVPTAGLPQGGAHPREVEPSWSSTLPGGTVRTVAPSPCRRPMTYNTPVPGTAASTPLIAPQAGTRITRDLQPLDTPLAPMHPAASHYLGIPTPQAPEAQGPSVQSFHSPGCGTLSNHHHHHHHHPPQDTHPNAKVTTCATPMILRAHRNRLREAQASGVAAVAATGGPDLTPEPVPGIGQGVESVNAPAFEQERVPLVLPGPPSPPNSVDVHKTAKPVLSASSCARHRALFDALEYILGKCGTVY